MSNATTVAAARAEFLTDLKRIKPKRDEFIETLKLQAQALASLAQKKEQHRTDALNSFIEAKKDEVELHIESELRARGDE